MFSKFFNKRHSSHIKSLEQILNEKEQRRNAKKAIKKLTAKKKKRVQVQTKPKGKKSGRVRSVDKSAGAKKYQRRMKK